MKRRDEVTTDNVLAKKVIKKMTKYLLNYHLNVSEMFLKLSTEGLRCELSVAFTLFLPKER